MLRSLVPSDKEAEFKVVASVLIAALLTLFVLMRPGRISSSASVSLRRSKVSGSQPSRMAMARRHSSQPASCTAERGSAAISAMHSSVDASSGSVSLGMPSVTDADDVSEANGPGCGRFIAAVIGYALRAVVAGFVLFGLSVGLFLAWGAAVRSCDSNRSGSSYSNRGKADYAIIDEWWTSIGIDGIKYGVKIKNNDAANGLFAYMRVTFTDDAGNDLGWRVDVKRVSPGANFILQVDAPLAATKASRVFDIRRD